MDLARPEFISNRPWLIAWILLLGALSLQQWLAHRRALSPAMARRFGPALSPLRLFLKLALWGSAAWFLLTALATPLGEPVKIESETNGADVILAVDVSSSMYAEDVRPNRLGAVKAAFSQFISRLGGDRVGLVAFAGDAVIACPLTTDYDTATLFLQKLDTDSVPSDGTGFAQAINKCLDGFQADPKRGRLIVFATDGEDTLDTDSTSAAKRAGESGVAIYTVGVGSPQGAYIPDRPNIFGQRTAKLYKGQPIIAKMNPETLRKIAELSGGQYIDGPSAEGLETAYRALRRLKEGGAKSRDRYVRDPLFQQPLLVAIALLLIEMMLSNRSGGTSIFAGRAWAFLGRISSRRVKEALPLALLALAMMCTAFSLDPGRGENDQGSAQYRQKQYDKAAQSYEDSIAQGPSRLEPHYNLGNAKFMQEDYDGAIAAYEDALKINPNDDDSKFNLDLAKKRKEEKENSKDKKDKDKDKKDGKDKGKDQGKDKGDSKGQGGQGNQQGQGQGQQGNSGQGKPQPGQGAGQGKGAQASQLSQDQIRAMMNIIKGDQKRYGQAFQPLKKYQKPEDQAQDPMEQMFEQLTGRPMHPQAAQGDSDRKNW
jgi:Ca-activated chloride channel family protein